MLEAADDDSGQAAVKQCFYVHAAQYAMEVSVLKRPLFASCNIDCMSPENNSI